MTELSKHQIVEILDKHFPEQSEGRDNAESMLAEVLVLLSVEIDRVTDNNNG